MKHNRFSGEQIVEVLKEEDAGIHMKGLYEPVGIRDPTFCQWKTKSARPSSAKATTETSGFASRCSIMNRRGSASA